jgi:hypothetical protein
VSTPDDAIMEWRLSTWTRERGPQTQNREGLTYVQWLAAAAAIDSSGHHISECLVRPHLYDRGGLRKNFSSILRKEWRRGVDPTEWRNYFDDEWATLESWRGYKRQMLRAKAAAARLDGTWNSDLPNGVPENISSDFFVATTFRVNQKQRRTERWWEKPH